MWNEDDYLMKKKKVQYDLSHGNKKPFDLMMDYKKSISNEDYELSKAITEVLAPLNYLTSDTHLHIKELNN